MANPANVQTGADGIARVAPVGSTAPTDLSSPDAAFVNLGYISEDGLLASLSTDSTDIRNWKGDIVKRVQTSGKSTFKLTFLEITRKTLEVYTGASFVGNILGFDSPIGHKGAWIFDILDPTNTWLRAYCPNAQITDREDWDLSNDAAGLGVTMTAYPGTDGSKAVQLIVAAGFASS